MAILNNLYPPQIDTYSPAFLIDSGNADLDTCRVYFSLSVYNTVADIGNVQVAVSSQYTNTSVLNKTKYPCEIMVTTLNEDLTRTSNDKYYIEIKKDDMVNNKFEINQYYKVQLRFTSIDVTEKPPIDSEIGGQAIDGWLAKYREQFSEWSTVCLIRGISVPRLIIEGIDSTSETVIWSAPNVDIIGRITFANENETETLKSYQIKLYDSKDVLLIDSGIKYTNKYYGINEINYTFDYYLQDGEDYKIEINYTTKDLYSATESYTISVIQSGIDKLNASISAFEDFENARIGISIVGNDIEPFTGNVTIRRSSSESNFTRWEDIKTISIEGQKLDFTWYDYTIESGIWYKYCAQKRNGLGNRGVILELKEPVMMVFEDMFLVGDETQLKLKFDPQISSFKYVVAESKTDTIGSKYPFVKRNGYTKYRQFPISGLISHFMDKDKIFTSRENIFNESLDLYNEYNEQERVIPLNDFTYEREFREKVMDFLYNNTVKLFRSATEGNILVKLTDISFTPNATLGRMIYSFSATANEIAEATISNYDKYNIQPVGTYDTHLEFIYKQLGQLKENIPANKDVLEIIQEKYRQNDTEEYISKIDYLDSLRIEMTEPPYLIGENSSGPYKINDTETTDSETLTSAYLGYIIYVNNQPIIINPEGIYELNDEGLQITSLKFPVDTQLNISYNVSVSKSEDVEKLFKTTNFYKKVGQYWGKFNYGESIYQKIWNKYYEKYPTYTQSLLSLDGIKIEADPGTIIYIKESGEQDYDKHIIGQTCTLNLLDKDIIIEDFYFGGIHFEEATTAEKEREILPSNKYIFIDDVFDSTDEIENPIRNAIYNIEGKDYIYYNDKYIEIDENFDAKCVVPALVDYYCEIMKGFYNKK